MDNMVVKVDEKDDKIPWIIIDRESYDIKIEVDKYPHGEHFKLIFESVRPTSHYDFNNVQTDSYRPDYRVDHIKRVELMRFGLLGKFSICFYQENVAIGYDPEKHKDKPPVLGLEKWDIKFHVIEEFYRLAEQLYMAYIFKPSKLMDERGIPIVPVVK